MTRRGRWHLLIFCILLFAVCIAPADAAKAQARNASFMNPNTALSHGGDGKSANSATTVVADPAQTDAGETLVNIARRITVFFYNGFRVPVVINDLTLNADGNVRSKILSDDCKALKNLPVQDRCSVAVEVVPTSPGPWSVELLLNHSGQGRIARAEVTGSTLGKADEKAEGLAISKKIATPLDFGEVRVDEEKATRTMLVENDSNQDLTIAKIDLISKDEGLGLRESGCKQGDNLKPGGSCPITIIWEPKARGNIATDLIVNHNGSLGFIVVPIRGKATADKETQVAAGDDANKTPPRQTSRVSATAIQATTQEPTPTPAPASHIDQEAKSDTETPTLPLIAADTLLPKADRTTKKNAAIKSKEAPLVQQVKQDVEDLPELVLIGTVGGRAILGDDDGQTHLIGLGEKTLIGGMDVELLQIDPTRVVVNISGFRKVLSLRNASSLIQASGKGDKDGKQGDSSNNDNATQLTGKIESRKSTPLQSATTPGANLDPAAQKTDNKAPGPGDVGLNPVKDFNSFIN